MSSSSVPSSRSAAHPAVTLISYPDFDPACPEVDNHKVGVWCSTCKECGMPWHKNLPFPGSEADDDVGDWESIPIGPKDSILEGVNLRSSPEIRILVLILASKLGSSFKSAELDAASKKKKFDILLAAADNIIEMTKTLEDQAEREDCRPVTWHNILSMPLRWPYENAEDMMSTFYKPSLLRKNPSNPPQSSHPTEIPDSEDERGYIDENENTKEEDGEEDSDPNDFSSLDRRYDEDPNWDLHTSPKHTSSGIVWILTDGQNFSPPKVNQADISKFVIFRSSADNKLHEVRQLPWWSTFDWSDKKHVAKLVKWRLQLFRRSGGEQKKRGNLWTQKERDMCLQFLKEEIALAKAAKVPQSKTKVAIFDAVGAKMKAFFKNFLPRAGEPLAVSDKKEQDDDFEVDVLKEDRLGVDREGKTINNQVVKSFSDINELVDKHLAATKKAKADAAKKGKQRDGSDEDDEEVEDGGKTESESSPIKKEKGK